jgi:hypothetical protein
MRLQGGPPPVTLGRIVRFETSLLQVVERQKPVLPGTTPGIGTQVNFLVNKKFSTGGGKKGK